MSSEMNLQSEQKIKRILSKKFKLRWYVIVILLILFLFFISGGHPIIMFKTIHFDIENDPVKEFIESDDFKKNKYEIITISKEGMYWVTSNGIKIEIDALPHISLDSTSGNSIIYAINDKEIFYTSELHLLSCMDHPMLFTIPLTKEHRSKYRLWNHKIKTHNKALE